MPDPRTIVEHELQRVDVPPFTLGTFHARRDRKRRNQRLAAGALGVSIALAGALIASQVVDGGPNRTAGQTPRNGAIAFAGTRGISLSDPDATSVHMAVRRVPNPPGECFIDRAHGCTFTGMTWSPDGSDLAFVAGDISAGILGDMSIYVMDAATQDVRFLSRCPARSGDDRGDCDNGHGISWSPDGQRLVFSSGFDLFLIDAGTGELEQITGCPSCAYEGRARHPVWAPTGDLIAFSGEGSLDVVHSDGTGWRMIAGSLQATFDHLNGNPSEWSPDGTELTFSATQGIYVVGGDGSDLRLVVSQHSGEGPVAPSWSPDGRRIVYLNISGTEHDTDRAEIRVVRRDGTDDQLLYRSACCISDWASPTYSPDGRLIAFMESVSDGNWVVVMTSEGGDVRRLPGYGDPAWQALPR
jgi:Tol biopolymer transport system component